MTTTVRVQARAWGARVEVQGEEPVDVGANQEHSIHIAEGESQTITVTHGEKPAENATPLEGEEVPGRAQNDTLLGRGERVGSNESGATETARTTDAAKDPPSQPQLGRGSRPSPTT